MAQEYCISARDRKTGITDMVAGPMSSESALDYVPSKITKKLFTYFRVAKYPFKAHKKGGR